MFDIFDTSEIPLGNTGKFKIVFQQKRISGEWKLDMRVWCKNAEKDEFFPLKSGICLPNQIFRDKLIQEIESYTKKYQ